MTSLGPSILLRSAGLSMRLWLAASAPELFRLLRSLDEQGEKYRELGRRLAERIGAELVPAPSLSKGDRRLALALRRQLHNGRLVATTDCKHIAALAARLTRSRGLAAELKLAAAHSTELSRLEDHTAKMITAEQDRLLRAPWELLRAASIGEYIFDDDNLITVVNDIHRRLARGEAWRSKHLRQASDYLWRMIARGAAKTTPRAWFGHVALVLVDEQSPDRVVSCEVTPEFASEWTENVHVQRRDLPNRRGGPITPDIQLAFAPLHLLDGEEFQIWAIDPSNPTRVNELSLRCTPLLRAVYTTLRDGAKPLCKLEASILPAESRGREKEVFRSFLSHLVQLGALQVSMPPRQCRTGWQMLGSTPISAGVGVASPPASSEGSALRGFVDIYRRAEGTLSADNCRHWQRSIEQMLRVMALIDADAPQPKNHVLERVGRGCRPALEILAEGLGSNSPVAEARRYIDTASWPSARTPGSGYDRLLDWIAMGEETNTPLDITPNVLDSLGAPERKLAWPLDCLVRPLASGREAVLSLIAPAGVLDARFVGALENLYCQVPHATAYRSFLEQLEKETGFALVELLVPPLSERAANAVRRPLYTRAWTGDPDLLTYCEVQDPLPQYLPLGDLMVCRKGDGLVIEANGKPIWPLYHATRMLPPPWDQLTKLLLHTSPQQAYGGRRLRYSLSALPGQDFVPRVTVGGCLILSTAQWRLDANRLWDSTASDLAKAQSLRRLQDRLGLPRWVFVSVPAAGQSFPCDLESLRAIRVLERVVALGSAADIVAEEMVPAPDQLPISVSADYPDDRVAAELMLRFPCDESPVAMATRVAGALGHIP